MVKDALAELLPVLGWTSKNVITGGIVSGDGVGVGVGLMALVKQDFAVNGIGSPNTALVQAVPPVKFK